MAPNICGCPDFTVATGTRHFFLTDPSEDSGVHQRAKRSKDKDQGELEDHNNGYCWTLADIDHHPVDQGICGIVEIRVHRLRVVHTDGIVPSIYQASIRESVCIIL